MTPKTANKFYDEIAEQYDHMTRFEKRLHREMVIIKGWTDRFGFKSALDLACGSGVHTIALSRLGIETTGVDISREMIILAEKNAVKYGVNPHFVCSSFADIDKNLKQKFDAVLILGNSLPHVTNRDELQKIFINIKNALYDPGMLIVQLLNYSKILREKNRIISIQREDDHEFIRFYDFLDELLQFNVLHVYSSDNKIKHQLSSTLLYPWEETDLMEALISTGYSEINLYGSMQFDVYDKYASENLVLICKYKT
ncbi:MAG: methyltransferase domain-containing protein [Calditrichaceae bacterium]|nr:methyltransferase domain-containing protein [Calditrichaceae bacterium]MBN2710214.1 methyltransferase domain-containing protein [Calditrichaceae bacterium]